MCFASGNCFQVDCIVAQSWFRGGPNFRWQSSFNSRQICLAILDVFNIRFADLPILCQGFEQINNPDFSDYARFLPQNYDL